MPSEKQATAARPPRKRRPKLTPDEPQYDLREQIFRDGLSAEELALVDRMSDMTESMSRMWIIVEMHRQGKRAEDTAKVLLDSNALIASRLVIADQERALNIKVADDERSARVKEADEQRAQDVKTAADKVASHPNGNGGWTFTIKQGTIITAAGIIGAVGYQVGHVLHFW
jgi:hypothetical protein